MLPTSDMMERAARMDSILATDIRETVPGTKVVNLVKKDNYSRLVAHRNLTTYSTNDVLHACPRKWALKKMQAEAGTAERINSPTFAFGHAVGAGVAVYDQSQDIREAIWAAFLAWDIDLLEEEFKNDRRTGKSFYEAVWALYTYRTFHEEETNLRDYEVCNIEATIAVDFEDGYFYSGHIDELLRHRDTGRFLVKENKTTGFKNIDPALYGNSDQALSYSVVIDMLGGTEYEVLYTIYSASDQRWVQMPFPKTVSMRAEWLQDQLLMHQQIDSYMETGLFPKRGRSCFQFMRRCELYQTCDLQISTVFGKEFRDLPTIQSFEQLGELEHVDFRTTLTEIIERQRRKLNGEV